MRSDGRISASCGSSRGFSRKMAGPERKISRILCAAGNNVIESGIQRLIVSEENSVEIHIMECERF